MLFNFQPTQRWDTPRVQHKAKLAIWYQYVFTFLIWEISWCKLVRPDDPRSRCQAGRRSARRLHYHRCPSNANHTQHQRCRSFRLTADCRGPQKRAFWRALQAPPREEEKQTASIPGVSVCSSLYAQRGRQQPNDLPLSSPIKPEYRSLPRIWEVKVNSADFGGGISNIIFDSQ